MAQHEAGKFTSDEKLQLFLIGENYNDSSVSSFDSYTHSAIPGRSFPILPLWIDKTSTCNYTFVYSQRKFSADRLSCPQSIHFWQSFGNVSLLCKAVQFFVICFSQLHTLVLLLFVIIITSAVGLAVCGWSYIVLIAT